MPLYPLFGGAITVSLDGDYLDASDMRQVPDNQEVLLSRTTNVSVIVEVLQCVAAHTSADGMRQGVHDHFDSLAHDNSAQHTKVERVDAVECASPAAGATPTPSFLHGTQVIPKFGKVQDLDTVHVYVALWRLPSKNVDLVLSVNDPEPGCTGWDAAHRAAHSLRIVDWGLFP